MSNVTQIKTMRPVNRAIYAYTTPNDRTHDGWIKIGDTEVNFGENLKDAVKDRVHQQTHTSDTEAPVAWCGRAVFEDDLTPFRDHDSHKYLTNKQHIERKPRTEWFRTDARTSKNHFNDFRENHGILTEMEGVEEYELRNEQEEAASKTADFFNNHKLVKILKKDKAPEFLWNAKPRFGKTLTAYDFCKRVDAKSVLILTNRPAIADSWYNDYEKFVGMEGGYYFVSQVDVFKKNPQKYKYVLSREEFTRAVTKKRLGCIEFISLQDLKGAKAFGGDYEKLREVSELDWDVLILDEAHEGVDTDKTDVALERIKRRFTLNLSGTPFKMLASDKFPEGAIFNWTYADEQKRKRELAEKGVENPYEDLPRLNLFTYQMSDMMGEKADAGTLIDDEETQYYFDLNEFFKTNDSGYFEHLEDVKKFLDALTEQKKYPFSTNELRNQLKHTFWLLNRVESAKALKRLLSQHPVFSEYEVLLAVGNGDEDSENQKAITAVREAIRKNDKTITLSVGQLTTGVTIPEWTAVLLLCSMRSPALYMQAAFRAQNPCLFLDKDGKTYRKDNAYVFDFDPARTLTIVETIANDQYKDTAGGAGDSEKRKKHVLELLNFFPVVGEDDDGEMIELDAEKVLSIPRHIHAKEVVNHGFMSNFLFQTISGIFAAPSIVNDILKKVDPVTKAEADKNVVTPEQARELPLDQQGKPDVPMEQVVGTAADKFGDPVFARQADDFEKEVNRMLRNSKPSEVSNLLNELTAVYDASVKKVVDEAKEKFGKDMTKSQSKEFERKLHDYGQKKIRTAAADFKIEAGDAEHKRDEALEKCSSKAEEKQINAVFKKEMEAAKQKFQEKVSDTQDVWNQAAVETVKAVEESKIEKKKNDIEEKVRDHLRGFARTIPSFLMAYGNDKTTLETFEQDIPGDVFKEVTSISVDEFKFLRDGGDYTDKSDGKKKHYEGHLFDSVVFNDSVKEFMRKRSELADYFKEDVKGDIFDYIPPQKTNQIFTPKKVVKQMVDMLEKETPGCFDDPTHSFADLYMKSGLYITEIIKRLYQSKKMKKLFPDDKARLEHIVKKQVYGAAPTEIIYMIAMHYIFGFNNEIDGKTASEIQALYPNFKMKDTAELAKNGTLAEWVGKVFK